MSTRSLLLLALLGACSDKDPTAPPVEQPYVPVPFVPPEGCAYDYFSEHALLCGGANEILWEMRAADEATCPTHFVFDATGDAWSSTSDAALGGECDGACLWTATTAVMFRYCEIRGEFFAFESDDAGCAPISQFTHAAGEGWYESLDAFRADNVCPFEECVAPAWDKVGECTGVDGDAPRITVRIVDETGAATVANRVLWVDPTTTTDWETAAAATCTSGSPPCSEWSITGVLPERVSISGEHWLADAPPEGCYAHTSALTTVHNTSVERQVVLLTLPTYATTCMGESGFTPGDTAWQAPSPDACTWKPPCVDGSLMLHLVDANRNRVPGTSAVWYYPPESPEYDGEHPLTCADALCTRFVLVDSPRGGLIYVSATHLGPIHPELGTFWSGFGATSLEYAVADDAYAIELVMEILESAFD
jgi:hypothetical protein